MKATFLLALLLAAPAFGQALSSTNRSTGVTNHLAIYLVAGEVPRDSVINGTATPEGLKLAPQPILSDPDFVAWDLTNHTFTITPAAAIRLGVECKLFPHLFVLIAEGVPIYLGGFWTSVSSTSCSVPVIMTDSVLYRCFMDDNFDRIPVEIGRMVARHEPGALERLMELAKNIPTTNVTLRIGTGYVSVSAEAFQTAEKRRDDPRVAAAVQKLFAERKH